jgi:RNA polymerase sigma-70 factor (sigma-E family)
VSTDRRDAAFERYVASRQHALLRTAVLLTGGDVATAEDLLQTALSRLYLAWHRVERESALDAYVRRIMVNQYTSWWRRTWRHRETTVDPVELPQQRVPGAVAAGIDDEVAERAAVWALVQLLPPRQRATVVLRYYEDLSEAETAEVLGCSVGTVKAASSRAVARLRVLHAEEVTS